MDIQLQELIDKIKKDGVANAEQAASQIIAEAEKKANSILEEAQKKSDDMIKNAKTEISRLEKASEDAITQACRNMLLGFRDSLISELDSIVQTETEKVWGNVEKANKVLGWKAEHTLEDSLSSAWKWQQELRKRGIM